MVLSQASGYTGMESMKASVDHCCPSCGMGIRCGASIVEFVTTGSMQRVTVNWSCPDCHTGFEKTTPFDLVLYESSGFHSWVGSVDGQPACIVINSANSVNGKGDHSLEPHQRAVGDD